MHVNSSEYSVVALFSSDLKQVVTSFNTKSKVRDLLADGVERCDYEKGGSAGFFAASRALAKKAGIKKSHLQIVTHVDTREWDIRNNVSHEEISFKEHLFLAIANEGLVLPDKLSLKETFTERKFVDIPTVLSSWSLPDSNPNRLNHFRAMALVRCLIFIQNFVGNDPVFKPFTHMLDGLYHKQGINLHTYISVITRGRATWKGTRIHR